MADRLPGSWSSRNVSFSGRFRPEERRLVRLEETHTEEQIAFALRQAESGTRVGEICRWKRKFAGMGVAEVRRLKQLEDENRKLKQLVADLSLDKQMLQDVISKKL